MPTRWNGGTLCVSKGWCQAGESLVWLGQQQYLVYQGYGAGDARIVYVTCYFMVGWWSIVGRSGLNIKSGQANTRGVIKVNTLTAAKTSLTQLCIMAMQRRETVITRSAASLYARQDIHIHQN